MFGRVYNRIFIYDLDSKELKMEQGDPRYAPYEKFLYTTSMTVGSLIYFGPCNISTILRYDPSDGSRKLIELGTENGSVRNNRGNCIHYNGKIYLFPTVIAEYIKVLDLKTEKVTHFQTNYSRYFSGLEGTDDTPFFCGNMVVGNTVWRTCFRGPFFQKFNFDSNQLEYIKINGIEAQLLSSAYDGECFWILPAYGADIYQWNPKKNRIRRTITIERAHHSQKNKVFCSISFFQGSMWVLLREEYCVIRIDTATGETEALEFAGLFENRVNKPKEPLFNENMRADGKWLYLFPVCASGIVRIDTETKEIQAEEIEVPGVLLDGEEMKVSESMCSLETFLRWPQKKETVSEDRANGSAGQKIWEHVTERMYT